VVINTATSTGYPMGIEEQIMDAQPAQEYACFNICVLWWHS